MLRNDALNAHAWYEWTASLALKIFVAPCPKGLPRLENVSRLSKRVTRIMGLNPSALTLQGTNTYLVGVGKERVLIDCGEGRRGYAENVVRAMRECGCERLKCVLLTHWHPDHVGGLRALREALGERVPAYKRVRRNHGEWAIDVADVKDTESIRAYVDVQDGDVIAVTGATLRAIHTPGHTVDHTCFTLEEEGAIFAGDCVLNGSTTDFEDLTAYSRSLIAIKQELEAFERRGIHHGGGKNRLYPSHGDVVEDGCAKVLGYVKHRVSRETILLNTLREHALNGMTAWELTVRVYASMVSFVVLYTSCVKITRQHVNKLLHDGFVKESRTRGVVKSLTFGLIGSDVVRYHPVDL